MINRANFTAGRIAEFECEPGKQQTIYWDGKAPGLGLRVTSSGVKAYVFESRLHGKTVRITLGSPNSWPLETQWLKVPDTGERVEHRRGAREEAQRLKSLTDQGIDPRAQAAERKAQSEAKAAKNLREGLLVSEVWDVYLNHHARRWGARHMQDHVNLAQAGGKERKHGDALTVAGVLRPVLEMRMSDISAKVLAAWVVTEAERRPNNTRQGFELFRAFWRWCAAREEYAGIIDSRAVEGKDLRAEVPNRKSKRFDVLQRAHLVDWFGAVRGIKNPVISAYLQGLLLTGARREELAELKWSDVDFALGAMWLKDKVRPEGRKVPLTPYLASLLRALPHRKDENNNEVQWVFSSPGASDGKLAEPRIAHVRALEAASLPHVSLHGLRRTFASLAEWVEIPRGVVAQIMGHSPNATAERHYISRPLELLAVWHGKYEAWILEQAEIEFEQPEPGLRLVTIRTAA